MAKKTLVSNETAFSKRICDYIEKSGFTVYKISQITGLDRTAIQHAMSSKFVPQKEFFEKLCSVFIITPQQKTELTELYLQARYGMKLYNERKQIKSIIENLPQYYINGEQCLTNKNKFDLTQEANVNGLLNVNQALISVISAELHHDQPRIASTIPFDNTLFYDAVIQMFSCSNNAVFEHFLRIFRSDNDAPNDNLNILENVLKMSMNAGVTYKPYNYYAYKSAVDDYLPIFPYCLITTEYLVMASENFQSAAVIRDKGTIEIANRHIEKLRQNSMPMIELADYNNMFEMFAASSRAFDKSIEFQPCVSKYLTFDIVKRRLKDIPNRDAIIHSLGSTFFTEEGIEITKGQVAKCVFSKKGLENFTATGVMTNLPGNLLEALSVDERIYILEEMKQDVGSYFIMLDDAKFSMPDFMQIIYLNNQNCLISCLMEEKKFCCVINERSLSLSMEDFISSLWDTGFTVGDDEQLAAIDECLESLRVGSSTVNS